jgi:hypothetical protein
MGFFQFVYDFILITGTTLLGVTGAFFITSQFVYNKTEQIILEEETHETIFEETYREEFDSLEKKEIPDKEIADNYCSHVDTPLGDVVMCYDLDKKCFNYYSNRRNIPVRFLDVVAQKFVIDHDCRAIYEEEELANEPEEQVYSESVKEPEPEVQSYYGWATSFLWSEKKENDCETERVTVEIKENDEEIIEDSVFASYKKKSEVKAGGKMIEKIMNTYKYKGTLNDYENTKKKEVAESLEISFSKFKEMVENKNE